MKKRNFWNLAMVALVAFGLTLSSFSTVEGSTAKEEVMEDCVEEQFDITKSTMIWVGQRSVQTSVTIGECETITFYTNFVLNAQGYNWNIGGLSTATTNGSAIVLSGSDFLPGGSTSSDYTTTLTAQASNSPTTASITVHVINDSAGSGQPCLN